MELDLVFKDGLVVDGTGGPAFVADVGIADGSIRAVGRLGPVAAARSIDARGLIVAPGFVDMHTHSDVRLLDEPRAEAKTMQGVTTEVIGQDPHVDALQNLGIPIVIEAWMSKNIDLLYKSVRKQKDASSEVYDPAQNLKVLHDAYPQNCVYLSMLSFKQDWKHLLPKL